MFSIFNSRFTRRHDHNVIACYQMLGASALHMASPLWRAVVPTSRIDALARLLEKREALPALLAAIDDAEERRRLEAAAPSDPPTEEASP